MKKMMKKLAVEGTANRRNALIEILEQEGIDYSVQEADFNIYALKEEDIKYMKKLLLAVFDKKTVKEMTLEEMANYFYPDSKLRNIIVNMGSNYDEAEERFLFSAHYDVVPGSTGAIDNASSLVILLRYMKQLKEEGTNKAIRFLFTDAEEIGGLGAEYYILKNERSSNKRTVNINLDVCGCGSVILAVLNLQNVCGMNIFDSLEKERVKVVSEFPESDATCFHKYGIETFEISTFPWEDARKILCPTKLNKKHKYDEIYKYMHNGKYDSPNHVDFEIMLGVEHLLKEMI